jgi:hypothetical protein
MQRDLQENRLKLILVKLETYLKSKCNLSQNEINKIGALKEEEVLRTL